ncbi:membrane protein [Bacillus coahuilensis m2-6]|uniref:VC0807 family protein n=1 Tax=Bacillus coahuilensis TaxID=408580 RepID=UPI0001850DAC|nr:VC0807 family protein [Bacillus coahuilensis]KUP08337.1 membrane protein [Bacillus coahuilensis m2-6]
MKKSIVVLDLICYLVLPLLLWNELRDVMGDYYAMLCSSVPGILYTIYRFYELKRVNVFGIYMLSTLIIGTLIDVLAGNEIQLLWNNVYYAAAMSLFFLGTIIFRKPVTLYFGLDFAELQGYDRAFSKRLFYQRELLLIFQLITLIFALRSGVLAGVKAWLIIEYGVDAFDKGIWLRQLFSWMMTGFTIVGFLHIGKIIQNRPDIIKRVEDELKEVK